MTLPVIIFPPQVLSDLNLKKQVSVSSRFDTNSEDIAAASKLSSAFSQSPVSSAGEGREEEKEKRSEEEEVPKVSRQLPQSESELGH